MGLFDRYRKEARRIIDDRSILFPSEKPENGDARLLVYPPGYGMLVAIIMRLTEDEFGPLWILQILCDALSAIVVFLIGLRLLTWGIGLIAGLLCAFSPHLSYYSLVLSPDSLPVLPVLLSVYLLVLAMKRPRLITVVCAGALIGISLWLRGNALLLAPFIATVIMLGFERGKRLRYAIAFVAATTVVIAPITIRNWLLFHRFIPLTLQTGLSLVEGIGDFDTEKRFGMPASDRETRHKDAEWLGRPDYVSSLWVPDGIERDQYRLKRGLEVVRSNPAWFAGTVFERAEFMLSYNDSRSHTWPRNTAVISSVLSEPAFGNTPAFRPEEDEGSRAVLVIGGTSVGARADVGPFERVFSARSDELIAAGVRLTEDARIEPSGDLFRLTGDGSVYADQFESAAIPVRKNTDYVLTVGVKPSNGDAAIKVTGIDRRIALASVSLLNVANDGRTESDYQEAQDGPRSVTVQLPFASGNRSEIKFVLSNNGAPNPSVEVGEASLYEVGPTPHSWTRHVRPVIRGLQKKLYTTALMVPLIVFGIIILAVATQWRTLAILLVVPFYYVCAHAGLHTEYRYTLAIHYFLFVAAAVSIYAAVALIGYAAARRKKVLSPES